MTFTVDNQTLQDLNIFSKRGKPSISSLFGPTATRGGASMLEQIFRMPLADVDSIERQSRLIRYFDQSQLTFPFECELFDRLEFYLSDTDTRSRLTPENDTLKRRVNNLIGADTHYERILKGVNATIEFLQQIRTFASKIQPDSPCYAQQREWVKICNDSRISFVFEMKSQRTLSYQETAQYDEIFRFQFHNYLRALLEAMYQIDVWISVASAARRHGFGYAQTRSDRTHQTIEIEGLFHPLLKNPVGNNVTVTDEKNIVFLTGANMAGKSTFMKSFCIAVYLAHLGFPVPARRLEFTPFDGMFTTINLPDNLSLGYSHFYAEVLRIKQVAQQIGNNKRLLVVFDELFRGTNVKDAFEATVAITEAFALNRECMFIISTHIIEAGERLQKSCDNLQYLYLPTKMENGTPKYTYTLASGITADRHGMVIIRGEHILELLHNGIKNGTQSR